VDIPQLEADEAIRSYIPGLGIPTLLQSPKTGRIYVNPLKQWVKPFTLTTEPFTMELPPFGKSQPIPMVIDNKGDFEIIGGMFESDQPEGFTVLMSDPAGKPMFSNREIHVSTIASGAGAVTKFSVFGPESSGGRVYRWPDSYWLKVNEKKRVLHCVFRNLSPLANIARFALHGLRWYHTLADVRTANQIHALYEQRRRIAPFFYTTEQFVKLAVGEKRDFDVRFTDGPWNEWLKSTVVSTGTFRVSIAETATGKRFMDDPIPGDQVFGPGEFPFMLWESALFEPNYKLTLSLENTAGVDNTIWVTLGCRHLEIS